MSELIKHECGIAMVRLLKPLEFYQEKYGNALYGLTKLQLLLQKMRNRGQDGAGLATIKLNPKPGSRYISRYRTNSKNYISDLFQHVYRHFNDLPPELMSDAAWLKKNKPYTGELLMGHLRYGTHGSNGIETCHPFLRQNNWISRNLVVAGNFNLTNVDELFDELVELGQHPKEKSDTVTVLEKIGHFLDDEVQRLFTWFKPDGFNNEEITRKIISHLDMQRLLRRASKKWDGGYVMSGFIGHGDAFMMRDPNGIRPAYYYHDDEVAVAASERPAIQTAFDIRFRYIKELQPGNALIVKNSGLVEEVPFTEPLEKKACSFERIYFSRGTDRDIYLERKQLGKQLVDQVLKSIDYDFENTVFSFVPNTAETAFLGLVEGMEKEADKLRMKMILDMDKKPTEEDLRKLEKIRPRVEKIVVKDAKMRTFIADNEIRGQMVSHVYDVTYGIVNNQVDTLVLVDDSIVRGTTLRDSIIKMVDRLHPKKIIFVSSAPQIRFPDCYGIDMSELGKFIAFQAAIKLIEERGMEDQLEIIYEKCVAQANLPKEEVVNYVKDVFEPFTYEEVSQKISEILTPPDIDAEVEIIYQTIDGLHKACPDNKGDWYFSGNYPTPGGNKVVNKSFINYMDRVEARAY
ncbi:class II glutamine amidotransferase [Membranihabitans maritimus]|uniref:class II glutamine amidotransferase n=1 Tax=Membranihabitans maritimus TaxID=2904244 RepID=UPI001F1643C0|nr:class II glutamine amidotransferase [Membranihabitans maritimus]